MGVFLGFSVHFQSFCSEGHLCPCGLACVCAAGCLHAAWEGAWGGLYGQVVTYLHQLCVRFPPWLHAPGQLHTCPRAPLSPADVAISSLQELGWKIVNFLSCRASPLLASSSSWH